MAYARDLDAMTVWFDGLSEVSRRFDVEGFRIRRAGGAWVGELWLDAFWGGS